MRRIASSAAAIVIAVALGPIAAAPPDPGVTGAYAVTTTSYDFGDSAFTIPTDAINIGLVPVEVRAEVHHPTALASLGELPLVVILHGHQHPCYDGSSTYDTWPCDPPSEASANHRGYYHFGRELASDGFIVVSISTNGIAAQDDDPSTCKDAGELARARLVERHLQLWENWDANGGDPFGDLFKGHVDLSRIGLVGHSRGGGGAARTPAYLATSSPHFRVQGVYLLSPYYQTVPAYRDITLAGLQGVAVNVVQSYCDGDSPRLRGVGYFDSGFAALPALAPRSMHYVMGANHFYWTSVLTSSPFPPGLPPVQDDWSRRDGGAYANDSWCRLGATSRLTDAQQRKVGSTYARAFFAWTLLGDVRFDDYFDVTSPPPPSLAGANVQVGYLPKKGPKYRLDVNLFAGPSSLTSNDLGGAVVATPLNSATLCGPGTCVPGASPFQDPHSNTQAGNRQQARIAWSGPGTSLANGLGGARDISQGAILLRVGVDYTVAMPVPDFSIRVSDDLGGSAKVAASAMLQKPFFPPGESTPLSPREILHTIRVPLASFSGVRTDRANAITLEFDRTSFGAIYVTDLMITDSTGFLVGPPFDPTVVFTTWRWPDPDPRVLLREPILLDPDNPIAAVRTTGFFRAGLLGADPASGLCSEECAVEVAFDPPAGVPSGEYFGELTYEYANGETHTTPLRGLVEEPCAGAGFCEDNDACTNDACDPLAGCFHFALDDLDQDGVCDPLDCEPSDPGVFALPDEVREVRFDADTVTLTWESAIPESGPTTTHALVRGDAYALPPGSGGTETCLATGLPENSLLDDLVPASGDAFWYLVRGENSCGRGSYGRASSGDERQSSACP